MFAAAVNRLHRMRDPRRKLAVFDEQLRIAQNAVQRRAHFVAHVCQKFAFGLIGLVRRVFCAAQRLFGAFQYGDVAHGGQQERPPRKPHLLNVD